MVRSVLTSLIILSFAGAVVFGVFAMNYTASSHCYGRCIEAIKIFSTSALSLLVTFLLITLVPAVMPVLVKINHCWKIFEFYPCKLKFTRWLALHENSPATL